LIKSAKPNTSSTNGKLTSWTQSIPLFYLIATYPTAGVMRCNRFTGDHMVDTRELIFTLLMDSALMTIEEAHELAEIIYLHLKDNNLLEEK